MAYIYGNCICGYKWSNLNESHCSACHEQFRNISGFDDHRTAGGCIDPREVGLVKEQGIWASPAGHERRKQDRARLARVRAPVQSVPHQREPITESDRAVRSYDYDKSNFIIKSTNPEFEYVVEMKNP